MIVFSGIPSLFRRFHWPSAAEITGMEIPSFLSDQEQLFHHEIGMTGEKN